MLSDLIKSGFGNDKDLNCAEKILYGANEVYGLGLDKDALRISAGFGGGMGIESVCGALTATIMVLGMIFVPDNARQTPRIKELNKEFFNAFQEKMGSIDCGPLKEVYRTEELKCHNVIVASAEVLDEILRREQ
jgi:C_GCAxxG_C_C family probable redox protein